METSSASQTKEPFFSVVIPVFNRAYCIAKTLESVFAQQFKDFEILLVDDGSTDNLEETIAPFLSKIRILRQENQGPALARNKGISAARGKFVCFLDSDDLWFPHTLQNFFTVLDTHPDVRFVAGTCLEFTENYPDSPPVSQPLSVSLFKDYFSSADENIWIGTPSVCIERHALIRVGGFSRTRFNAEDSDLWLKLGDTPTFALIRQPESFAYRRHKKSLVSNEEKTIEGLIEIIRKERKGEYPGSNKKNRIKIICRHIRPICISLAKKGNINKSILLYLSSILWNIKINRLKFIIGFPVILSKGIVKRYFAIKIKSK